MPLLAPNLSRTLRAIAFADWLRLDASTASIRSGTVSNRGDEPGSTDNNVPSTPPLLSLRAEMVKLSKGSPSSRARSSSIETPASTMAPSSMSPLTPPTHCR